MYGSLDVPLSAAGERETARRASAFAALPLRRILCSDLSRARRLGEALSEATGAPLELRAELREIDRGRWQGRDIEELQAERGEELAALMADPWSWNRHGGETDADVLARAGPTLEAALTEEPGRGPIAVVAHYNVVRVLVSRALGIPPRDSFRLRLDLARAVLLRDDPEGFALVRGNVESPR